MRDDGVLDGDLVIGQVTDRWNAGDMVAAWLVDEKLATLKRIEETDRKNVRLVPANPAFQPRIFEKDKVLVQARIFAVFHRFWE
jgi:SOS-response transcriptional repressor LexA